MAWCLAFGKSLASLTSFYAKLGDSAYVRKRQERNEGVGCHARMPVYGKLISGTKIGSFWLIYDRVGIF